MHDSPLVSPLGSYTQISQCRVCGGHEFETILSLGDQFLIGFVNEKNPLLPKAPLDLLLCHGCGLLQLKHSVEPDLLWKMDYWYRSGMNQTMKDALHDVVSDALYHHDSGVWCDIGANDGTLLSHVPPSFTKIGVEPGRSMHAALEEHADEIVDDFFSADAMSRKCEIITACACFYDVDDPLQFLKDVADRLTPQGVFLNQLSDATQMIRQNAWDAVCHEHKAYYDLAQLQRLYAEAGLVITSVSENSVNGGSIRVTARKGSGPAPLRNEVTQTEVRQFAERVRRWKDLFGWFLDSFHMSGRSIWAYGASTKGSVLLQHLNRNEAIRAIADRNPKKHGTVQAGTWLPVTDEDTMRQAKPDVLLMLPWAFKQEFNERERALRDSGTVLLYPLPTVEVVI